MWVIDKVAKLRVTLIVEACLHLSAQNRKGRGDASVSVGPAKP